MAAFRPLIAVVSCALAGSLLVVACSGDDEPRHLSGSGSSATGSGGAGGGASGSGGETSSTSSGGNVIYPQLGAACAGTEDCGNARCATVALDEPVLGGGPVGGYCTADCDTDAECGDNGKCANGPKGKGCLLRCSVGPKLSTIGDPLSDAKCLGREEVGCFEGADGDAVCLPTCGGDGQCAGRACSGRLGVCINGPFTGNPAGAVCDPAADQCKGVCAGFDSGAAVCTSYCVLGGALDAADCGGKFEGACSLAPTGHGAGDRGFCAAKCQKQDDCQNPSFWCGAVAGVTGDLVPLGFCGEAASCDGGQACAKGTCAPTKYGDFCLDTSYPLGNAAP